MEKHVCSVNGCANPKFSLPLKRENGKWVVKPVCGTCRAALSKEARLQKKFIPFYGLEASLKEAEKRNAELGKYKLFVSAFAKARAKSAAAVRSTPPQAGDRPLKPA